MQPSTNVSISDMSRAILEMEREVSKFDADIRNKVTELLKVQQELSMLVTHRDALMGTIRQISDYRYGHNC